MYSVNLRHIASAAFTVSALILAQAAPAQTNLAYWNFNDASGTTVNAAQRANLFSVDGGTNVASAIMSTTFATADGTTTNSNGATFFNGTTINAVSGDVAGFALALQGSNVSTGGAINNGQFLNFSVSTVGYENIVVSLAIQRTGTGFGPTTTPDTFQFFNGTAYQTLSTFTPASSFAIQSFDLSAVGAVRNSSNAQFRILFDGATSTAGNNRLDNLIIGGSAIQTTAAPEASGLLLILAGSVPMGILVARRRRI